jgi:hypothetical protein
MTFDAKKYLIKVQGGRQYLPVSARLIWFREEHADWGISTRPVVIDTEKQFAVFEATVCDQNGILKAMGTKMEDIRGFNDYVEKAETGAIGRALAVCGFGTQFASEIDESDAGRYVDSPQTVRGGAYQRQPAESANGGSYRPANNAAPVQAQPVGTPTQCAGCGREIRNGVVALSMHKYRVGLCPDCQKGRDALAKAPEPPRQPAAPTQAIEPDPFGDEYCVSCAAKGQETMITDTQARDSKAVTGAKLCVRCLAERKVATR